MEPAPKTISSRERGAALVIVLAFVVLLTGLAVAYLSRATSDRPVAHSSFNQSKADQLAASGMDLVIGGLRQEITGPAPTPTPPTAPYVPANNARMLPLRSGTPSSAPAIPNLVRRSIRSDPIPAPGVSSLASAVNSTTDVSANGRSVSLARWNKHYLMPKLTTGDDSTDPVASFVAPDWVILTRTPRTPTSPTSPYPVAFSSWDPALKDPTSTNNLYAVGRYAYAIYDEGGLLDANVAGYPSGTTPDQSGRKGPVAFADLNVLPYPISNSSSPYQIDRLVGWRNYGATQPNNNFPDTSPAFAANFRNSSAPALAYWNSIINRTAGFTTTSGAVAANGRTDQMFLNRQQLIAFRATTQFSSNALQYLSTFCRELNAPSWKPSTPAGSSIDYATLANTPTARTSIAINRDLLNVYVPGTDWTKAAFTRADGTTADQTDLLIKQRFPLSRINGLADPTFASTAISTINNGVLVPASATTVQRDFGLFWNSANKRWDYVGATGSTVLSAIERLDQVAAENREPNFFELLKAVILSASVGIGSGSGSTFVAAEGKYYNNTSNFSADSQIMQIGANIIDQWDSDNIPTFIGFKDPTTSTVYEIAGIENLPYLNKLVFKPSWTSVTSKGVTTYTLDAWLIPSLWNPHQNAPPAASQNVQIAMTSGTLTANTTSPTGATSALTGSATLFMAVDASLFPTSAAAPTPSGPTTANGIKSSSLPAGITKSADNSNYGFHPPSLTGIPSTTPPSTTTTVYPSFGAGTNFELQVQVSTSPSVWKAYQRWTGCSNTTPVTCQSPSTWLPNTNLQDPEFVTLDPRTLRFGAWANDAKHSAVATDYTTGLLTTLDQGGGTYETITALPPTPQGTNFIYTGPPYALYNYANNPTSSTVYYKDLDTLRRQGDIISGATTAMLPADVVDRPQILNRPFQSLAELGQVFRDQPWKTLDFTTASSPDAGLLDVFTLHESANEGGKTSLNTSQKPALTAILSQATKRLTDSTGATVITSAQRDAIVNALFNITSTNPMIRKTDLLTQLANDLSVTVLGNKEARELVMRAFSDTCQTRSWNLLIDLVAQSGRYPPTASSLAGFLVEGEQHYWVHVAIDRFTGQVVDKQIEVVNE